MLYLLEYHKKLIKKLFVPYKVIFDNPFYMKTTIRHFVSYFLSNSFIFILLIKVTMAQNAPVTTISTIGNAIPNQQITIPTR